MPRDYALTGESGALYNGAQDSEGGIWIRIRDENDRRILAAAIDKQKKNQVASIGTLTALDPNAGHLTDYVGSALDRILEGVNGARSAAAQLDGTPMGRAISDPPEPEPEQPKRARKPRGGAPAKVSDVLKTVPGGPLPGSPPAVRPGTINWADTVPTPRPEPGQTLRTSSGHATSLDKVLGFDPERVGFRIIDAAGWDGVVVWHAPTSEWRILSQLLDYPVTGADAVGGEMNASDVAAGNGDESAASSEPYAPETAAKTPPRGDGAETNKPQRKRNATSAGLERASRTPRPPTKAKSVGKKRR